MCNFNPDVSKPLTIRNSSEIPSKSGVLIPLEIEILIRIVGDLLTSTLPTQLNYSDAT